VGRDPGLAPASSSPPSSSWWPGSTSWCHTALNLERLRIDEKGVRVRPAGRIPWEHIQSVTYRGPHALAVKLTPDSPLPRASAA
jgi:hypothetical protein